MNSKVWCLGLISLILLLGTSCSRLVNEVKTVEKTINNTNSEPQKLKYRMGEFTLIPGTDYLIAPVHIYIGGDRKGESEYSSYSTPPDSKDGKSYYNNSVHNFVITNRQDLSSRKLFANNKFTIIEEQKLGETVTEAGKTTFKNVKAIMYRVAKADTNNDKFIDNRDKQEVALADVDGNNYKELITGIDRVINIHSQSKDKRVVFYQTGQDYFTASIDIPTRSVTTKKLESIVE
jgi:hypothetical protein